MRVRLRPIVMFVRRTSTFPTQEMGAVAQLAQVRARFVEWLHDVGVGSEQADDLSVVVSELGANAIRETPPGAPPADFSARIDGSTVEIVVTNDVSSATHCAQEWDLEDPLRTGGRGLLLVSAFVDDIAIDVVGRRLVVTCRASVRDQT